MLLYTAAGFPSPYISISILFEGMPALDYFVLPLLRYGGPGIGMPSS